MHIPHILRGEDLLVLITYDVSTKTAAGAKRLSKVAKVCTNFGQRVQNSVFECIVDSTQLAMLKKQISDIIDVRLTVFDTMFWVTIIADVWNMSVQRRRLICQMCCWFSVMCEM